MPEREGQVKTIFHEDDSFDLTVNHIQEAVFSYQKMKTSAEKDLAEPIGKRETRAAKSALKTANESLGFFNSAPYDELLNKLEALFKKSRQLEEQGCFGNALVERLLKDMPWVNQIPHFLCSFGNWQERLGQTISGYYFDLQEQS
jgi:hypothetical protein